MQRGGRVAGRGAGKRLPLLLLQSAMFLLHGLAPRSPARLLCRLPLPAPQHDRMRALFRQGCRLEWCFWDGAFHRQQWLV